MTLDFSWILCLESPFCLVVVCILFGSGVVFLCQGASAFQAILAAESGVLLEADESSSCLGGTRSLFILFKYLRFTSCETGPHSLGVEAGVGIFVFWSFRTCYEVLR